MKTLIVDIETSPNLAHVWGLWQQNVGLPQLLGAGQVLCWAAKWEGEDRIHFGRLGQPKYIQRMWNLLNSADVVVHFNGDRFDLPWLRTEFVKAQMTAPSPFVSIDLCSVAKRQFRFPSNKLQYLSGVLLEGGKVSTGGHGLWIKCMSGDAKAWATMREYNEHDVVLTEALYARLKPWVKPPSPYLYGDVPDAHSCPQCGSTAIQHRGKAYTALTAYNRLYCNDCGRWSRGKNLTRQQGPR